VLGYIVLRTMSFFILNATWAGDATVCRAGTGACWPFLQRWLGPILYGFIPPEGRWIALVAMLGLAAVLVLAFRYARPKAALVITLLTFAPLVLAVGPAATWLGLPSLQTTQLGGLLLTMIVAGIAIVLGLPVGLCLALMRVSSMPLIRMIATVWVEIGRGVPTVVTLFFAITVFPLLTPSGLEIDKLLRVLLAFVFLTSAQFAETIRGGLQSVLNTQREAAWSLGLSYMQTLRLIILPQALTVALPNIVNVCVALIKETTLVLVIGLYDVFGMIQMATLDPMWAHESVTLTGYMFAALMFWAVCSFFSRLAARLERRSVNRS
jgi:general L-amino acid transport system permease protein